MIDTSTAAVEAFMQKFPTVYENDRQIHALVAALAADRDALAARAEAAEKIVERLPKTADGVAVYPGMMVYEPPDWKPFYCAAVYAPPRGVDHSFYADCYSAREAAAKGKP